MTLQEELSHGTLSKVAPDEPIFVLRAKDLIAPGVVQTWATLAISKGVNLAKVKEANECRLKMIGWQVKNGAKYAD